MLKILVTTITLLFTSLISFSQYDQLIDEALESNDEQKIYNLTNVLMLDTYLHQADTLVDRLLTFDSNNPEYNYFKGIIELYSKKEHEKSIPYFLLSETKTGKRIDLFKISTEVTNDTYFHIASAHHYLKNFDKAEEFYNKFKELCVKSSILYNLSDVRIEQCKVARKLIAEPIEVNFVEVPVNTENPEYSSVISANGRELFFTSRRSWENIDQRRSPVDNTFPEDIYMSTINGANVSNAERLELCESHSNESNVSLSPDMSTLYVYSDSVGNGDVFISEHDEDNKFKTINQLTFENLNTKNWETHIAISIDSSMIIFSSDRKKGHGGRDLWVIYRNDEDSSWSAPVNMGPSINSSEDEDSPFLTLDNKTLYFSTNGKKSMGGFDIMKSDYSDKNWSESENLGYPINSTGDDIFYSVTSNGTDGYYTSFREGGKGEKDIYHIEYSDPKADDIIALCGGVINITEDTEDIEIIVTLINKTDNENISINVKGNNFFEILDDCKDYSLEMKNSANDELLLKEDFKTNCNNSAEHLEKYYYNGQYYINGLVADENGKSIEGVSVELVDKKTGESIAVIQTDENGQFKDEDFKDLRPGDSMNVSLKLNAENYASDQFEIDTLLGNHSEIAVNYSLKSQTKEDVLNGLLAKHKIYFEYDKSRVTKSEKETLDAIVVILNDNPEESIVVQSHTDCRGTEDYNQRLSDRRAKSTAKYIKSKISNPDRVTSKGMGEKNLVGDCGCEDEDKSCTDEQHKENRRTTFEVVVKVN